MVNYLPAIIFVFTAGAFLAGIVWFLSVGW